MYMRKFLLDSKGVPPMAGGTPFLCGMEICVYIVLWEGHLHWRCPVYGFIRQSGLSLCRSGNQCVLIAPG